MAGAVSYWAAQSEPNWLAIGCESDFSQKAARGYGPSLAQCLDR